MEGLKRRVSFADLQRMPEDGHRYELYDGALHVVPSPLPLHEIVKHRILDRLKRHALEHGGAVFDAPFDIVFSDHNVVQPDLLYFSAASARRIRLDEHVRFSPDLAVEVLSPSTARRDRGPKRDLFERFGLRELWLVDPQDRCVEVFVLRQGRFGDPPILRRGILESRTIPGLIVNVAPVFESLDSRV